MTGDCRKRMREIASGTVKCTVTSPPFYKQRDYGVDGQIGQEESPAELARALRAVGREIRRVLTPDGTFWLQLGDTYASGGNGGGGSLIHKRRQWNGVHERRGWRRRAPGYKEKDITLTPFLVAEALRKDGWYLRSTIVWNKSTATEPPRLDRPSTAHEYLFLLSKSEKYAVRDPGEDWFRSTVWTIRPQPSPVDHPAVMPVELARRCIVCSTAPGDLVLDPFGGSGTTGLAADRLQRDALLIELNPGFAELSRDRIRNESSLLAEVECA